jgi:hypothetical protein
MTILQEWTDGPGGLRDADRLLGLEIKANRACSYAKLRSILQDRCADAFILEKSAIGGFQILQADEEFTHLQQTMVPREFRIVECEVRALSADDRARLSQRVGDPSQRTGNDRENDGDSRRELKALVHGGKLEAGGGGVRAGERRHRRDDHRFIRTPLDLYDSRLAAAGAPKLYLRVLDDHFVLQDVLPATVNARCLHHSKIPRRNCERVYEGR